LGVLAAKRAAMDTAVSQAKLDSVQETATPQQSEEVKAND